MPNLGSVLKQEIARIARREIRAQTNAAKKATTQHRRHIAFLRRRIDDLEKRVAALAGVRAKAPSTASAETANTDVRFVAKGVRAAT
jgi:hypothetical protein